MSYTNTGHESMTILQLANLLEMYALISSSPDNLIETQEAALMVSAELKYRIKGLERLHGEMNRRFNGLPKKEKAIESANDLEEEDTELELRNKEEGR